MSQHSFGFSTFSTAKWAHQVKPRYGEGPKAVDKPDNTVPKQHGTQHGTHLTKRIVKLYCNCPQEWIHFCQCVQRQLRSWPTRSIAMGLQLKLSNLLLSSGYSDCGVYSLSRDQLWKGIHLDSWESKLRLACQNTSQCPSVRLANNLDLAITSEIQPTGRGLQALACLRLDLLQVPWVFVIDSQHWSWWCEHSQDESQWITFGQLTQLWIMCTSWPINVGIVDISLTPNQSLSSAQLGSFTPSLTDFHPSFPHNFTYTS